MALDYTTEYPAQIITTDAGYPYGKPRNRSGANHRDGTPWESRVASDIFGLLQSLLVAGSVTPSGSPDEVGTSDYLDALHQIISDRVLTSLREERFDQHIPSRFAPALIPTLNSNSRFSAAALSLAYTFSQASVADAGLVYIPFNIPFAEAVITDDSFAMKIRGANGSHGALPATMPKVRLLERLYSGSVVVLASVTDASADVATYETIHSVTATHTGTSVRRDSQYFIELQGETGANSETGLEVYSVTLGLEVSPI